MADVAPAVADLGRCERTRDFTVVPRAVPSALSHLFRVCPMKSAAQSGVFPGSNSDAADPSVPRRRVQHPTAPTAPARRSVSVNRNDTRLAELLGKVAPLMEAGSSHPERLARRGPHQVGELQAQPPDRKS